MSTDSSRPTPLGVARARFVEGLPRKAQELRGSVALLAGTPSEEKPREELRRRLHALYASAQVFQLERLAAALKESIGRLDRARDERRGLTLGDIDSLASLAATLPVLGADAPTLDAESVSVPRAAPLPSMSMQGRTLKGVPAAPPPRASAPPKVSVPPPPPSRMPAPPLPAPGEGASLREELAVSIEKRASPPAAPALRGAPVISVLVCDGAETQARVRALLAGERFEVLGAADPEEALRLSRSSAPDVVLVDRAVLSRSGSDFVRRLRDDPLTDFVPMIAIIPEGDELDGVAARALGCEDVLARPLAADTLERSVTRLAALDSGAVANALSGDLTVAELAGKIAEEIRRGLVESLDRGRDLSVPIGDGTEVLAATWSAIGRLRAHLSSRSGGRVHFREREGAASTLALVDDETATDGGDDVSLRDRRILIADDDPAVVWFFASLLREAGAIATEAHDGIEALEAARRERPDVIIADILMPRLDGFSLTRELKRDPVLCDVPVVLLSWKEDFLQRMRELSAGASGYLRKEAGAGQILAAVREVLRPRARLEQRLRAGGDVRGRLERIGIIPLLNTAAQHRPDARITVRDAWNLFEIDLRKKPGESQGSLVDITRTASDGSFSRGPKVVIALLGATEGRFTVADSEAPVRASVREPLEVLLVRSANELGGLVDAVSGRGLLLAHRVEFDEDVLASILRAAPSTVAAVVDALRRGRGPRALVVHGTFAPQDVERVLVDLARQGAISAVFGEANEDRVIAARKGRGETALPMRTPSLLPPRPPTPEPESLTPSSAGLDLSWAKGEEETGSIVRNTLRQAGEGPISDAPPKPAMDDEDEGPVLQFGTASESDDDDDLEDEDEESGQPAADPTPVTITVRTSKAPPPELPPEAPTSEETSLPPEEDEDEDDGLPPLAAPVSRAPVQLAPVAKTAARPPVARPPEQSGPTAFQWTFILAALVAVGFAGYRYAYPVQSSPPSTIVLSSIANVDAGFLTAADLVDAGASNPSGEPVQPTTATFSGYGRDEEGIAASYGVTVPAGQGLLVLEPGAEPMQVRIGQDLTLRLDHEPVAIALPEAIHDLAFVRGDGTSFRFARVAAGHTRYVPAP